MSDPLGNGDFRLCWSETRLNGMRDCGDPLADETMAVILARGDRKLANLIMRTLHRPDHWPPNTPPEVKRYLEISGRLPDWADEARLSRAYDFLATRGLRYGVVLLYLSLPVLNAAYTGGAQTLALTGELSNTFARRVSETVRFVRAVIEDRGLIGRGVAAMQNVRLMHAGIRHWAELARCSAEAPYYHPQWGKPINQEALCATMLSFSTVAVDGLRKLSLEVSADEEDAFLHFWRVVGHVLGIEDANMPSTVAEAKWFWERFKARNFGRSAAGVMLVRAHIDFMRDVAKDDFVLSEALKHADEGLMRYLMGDEIAVKMLGVPETLWSTLCADVGRVVTALVSDAVDHSKLLERWVEEHATRLADALQQFWNKEACDAGTPTRPFHIPAESEAEGALRKACALNASDQQ
jgi:hypothetical protein